MPRLTNPQIEQLLDAMLDTFDTPKALSEFLQFDCDQALDQIASPNDDLRSATRKVINAANAAGWIADLLRGAAKAREGVAPLQTTIATLLAWVEPPPPDPTDPPPEPGPLPPGSRPGFPRNAVFTGRADDLQAIAAHFLPHPDPLPVGEGSAPLLPRRGPSAPPLLLTGVGGTGKSQLANEFCHRYGRYFEGVHWVATTAGIEPEIAACGLEMGVQPWPQGQPEQVATTLRAWRDDSNRLVVLDNLEEPEALRDLLARLGDVRVLVTARNEDWPTDLGAARYPLGLFDRAESRALLRALAPRLASVPDAELDPLAQRLGDLPLALDLAGRYLADEPEIGVADYLAELDAQKGSALRHESFAGWANYSPTKHALSLIETFLVSWGRLLADKRAGDADACLFRACGYCAPNAPIPVALLEATLGAEDDRAVRQVARGLRALDRLGLLEGGDGGPRIHPLLADFARIQDGAPSTAPGVEPSGGQPAQASTPNEDEGSPHASMLPPLAVALGNLASAANATGLPANAAPYRPHLETVALAAEAAALDTTGLLWNELGYHLNVLADYRGARASYERALRIDEAALGPDHPNVASFANNLGSVARAQGGYPGARAYLERALRIDEAAPGPDHPNVATMLNNLGSVAHDQGDYASARAYYKRALRISEATLGPDHPSVAICLNNLGLAAHAQGDYAGARAYYERALRISEAALGPDYPSVATRLNNLGMVAQDQGDFDGARAYFERALRIDEAALGPDHPNVARELNNLGLVSHAQGDYAGARTYHERALRIDEAALGPDHPNVATMLNNLGSVAHDQGDYASARAYYERALRIDEAALGPDHPQVAIFANNLGMVAHAQGDYAGARAYYERALSIVERALPPDHPNIATVRRNLAALPGGE